MEKSAVNWLIEQINGYPVPLIREVVRIDIPKETIEEARKLFHKQILKAVIFGQTISGAKNGFWEYSPTHKKFMNRSELYYLQNFEHPTDTTPPPAITPTQQPSIVQEIFAFLEEGKVSELAEMKEWFLMKEQKYYGIPETKTPMTEDEFMTKWKEVLEEIKTEFKKLIDDMS